MTTFTPTAESVQVLTGEALRAVIAERMKQVVRHGRSLAHDQKHNDGADLALAGASYANAAIDQLTSTGANARDLASPDPLTWPWLDEYWKPEDPRANLVKAAALLWAAIDHLDNAPRDAGDVDNTPDYDISDDGVMTALPTWSRNDRSTWLRLELVATGTADLATVAGWTDEQVQQADIWAWTTHLSASDNEDIKVPAMPPHVEALGPYVPKQAG